MERMTPMKKSLKKTICVVLCALILFCSFVFVGSAESVDHPSGPHALELKKFLSGSESSSANLASMAQKSRSLSSSF